MQHRLTFQRRAPGLTPGGTPVDTWEDVATVWAMLEPVRDGEDFIAGKKGSTVTHHATIRYCDAIRPEQRALYCGRTFDVLSVVDVREQRRHLRVALSERTS